MGASTSRRSIGVAPFASFPCTTQSSRSTSRWSTRSSRHTSDGREFFHNLAFFATYTSNWFVPLDGRVIFYFSWSLAAEEQFYLLWPSVQKFFSRRRAVAGMLVFIVAVLLLQQWAIRLDAATPAGWRHGLLDFPLAICFGVVLAHLLHSGRSYRALHPVLGMRWSSTLWALLFLAALQWHQPAGVVHLCAALFVGACVYREDHVLAPWLRWRVLAYIGTVSYGVYLMHMLVKNAATRALAQQVCTMRNCWSSRSPALGR